MMITISVTVVVVVRGIVVVVFRVVVIAVFIPLGPGPEWKFQLGVAIEKHLLFNIGNQVRIEFKRYSSSQIFLQRIPL